MPLYMYHEPKHVPRLTSYDGCFQECGTYISLRGPQVMKSLLPITRCLVGGHGSDPDGERGRALALNQLLELVQVNVLLGIILT